MAGGGVGIDSFTPDSGTSPVVPTAGGLVSVIGSGSTTTVGGLNSLTVQLTGLTNNNVLIGAGTTTITKVAPPPTVGVALVSTGAASDPAFGTVTIAGGGTGVSTLTDGGVILGSGTGAVTSLAQATNGQLVIGSTGADPVLAVLVDGEAIDTTTGAGSITIACETATDTNLGVATFDANDFLVTAGDVTLAARNRLVPGYIENLGIDYNGGTGVFTVQGGAAALASTNPAFVTLQSKADPGELVTHEITANQSFIDDAGASEILNNLFGLTTGIAYASDIPFFLYAVTNDNEDAIAFMISRNPAAKVAPAAANIGAPDDAVADAQGDFWSIDNIDETLYDGNPCLCIGAFRMQMSASDDWTVTAIDNTDGIGQYHEQTPFAMLEGTFGAQAGTYWEPNAGTEPQFATNTYYYQINSSGLVWISCDLQNVDNTPAGANALAMVLPYENETTTGHNGVQGTWQNSGTGTNVVTSGTINGGSNFYRTIKWGDNTVVTMQNTAFQAGYGWSLATTYSAF